MNDKFLKKVKRYLTIFISLSIVFLSISSSFAYIDIYRELMLPYSPINGVKEAHSGDFYAKDIKNHKSEPFITVLYEVGAVQGTGNGKAFNPEKLITKAEMLKITIKLFKLTIPEKVLHLPFIDVRLNLWYTKYFAAAKEVGIIKGYNSKANPGDPVNFATALTILARASGIDISSGANYPSRLVTSKTKKHGPQWWNAVWRWAEMNGLVNDKFGDSPERNITRAQMAELAVKVYSLKIKTQCNCDNKKVAWDVTENNAEITQQQANPLNAREKRKELQSKRANRAMKVAEKKVSDLNKFFDDVSYVIVEGQKITSGDLKLLAEANFDIYQEWRSKKITAETATEEWAKINRNILEKLRTKKRKELEDANKELKTAKIVAEKAKQVAVIAREKANKLQKIADEARAEADAAKKAYENCIKTCKITKVKLAKEMRRLEEERRKKALQKSRQGKTQKNTSIKTTFTPINNIKGATNTNGLNTSNATSNSNLANTTTSGISTSTSTQTSTTNNSNTSVSTTACNDVFITSIATQGGKVTRALPESTLTASEFIPATKELIATAYNIAMTSGGSISQIANTLSELPQIAYSLWPDYIGSMRSNRTVANQKTCELIRNTEVSCGSLEIEGETNYWERSINGEINVIEFGPEDAVTVSTCD